MSPLIHAIQFLIITGFNLYLSILFLRILLQGLGVSASDPISLFVMRVTRYPMFVFNRIIPRIRGIDTPAIVFIFLLEGIKLLLLSVLFSFFPPHFFGVVIWGIGNLLHQALNLYFYIIIFRVLLSWIKQSKLTNLLFFLHRLTEPLFSLIRKVFPVIFGMDLSPIFAIIVLQLLSIIFVIPITHLGKALAIG